MIQTGKNESMTAIVVLILAIGLLVWGWMRAHSQTELNPVHKAPAGSGGGFAGES
ncbi:MAG: hypothetical protein QOJ65_1936 [Fimbriimonadaceae bacterium]|jgi:high-affinity Fe2+/Pb2+ permease|nr:hypothetical protein [Fimbriimonadaceae bacterium]